MNNFREIKLANNKASRINPGDGAPGLRRTFNLISTFPIAQDVKFITKDVIEHD